MKNVHGGKYGANYGWSDVTQIKKDWATYFSLGPNLQGASKLEKKAASVERK
jgi:hypothetical protein